MLKIVTAPQINTNDDRLEVVVWHVAHAARVNAGQDIVDVETSKAVVTLQAEQDGFCKPIVMAGDVVRVGSPLYALGSMEADLHEEPGATPVPLVEHHKAAESGRQGSLVHLEASGAGRQSSSADERPEADAACDLTFKSTRFSRRAAQMLADRGLAPKDFAGQGLITTRMLQSASPDRPHPKSGAGNPRLAPTPVEVNEAFAPPTLRHAKVPLSKHAEIASLTRGELGNINSSLTVYFDSTPVRERLRAEQALDGNIQPLILFEVSRLLKEWPQLTAYFHDGVIHYYDRVDIGLAFDMGKGLKVVTLPVADRMTPADFFQATLDIGLRYLENKIRPDELGGSSITVTDLSGFDILQFQPLINGPQSAIIGIGGDAMQVGHPMSLTVTFDHRVTNGREVATFLQRLRERIMSYALRSRLEESEHGRHPSPSVAPFFKVSGCDRCGISMSDYYRDFPRDGYMTVYARQDGSLGGVCHRCAGGWA